jgi:uncharacterized membrane protein
MTDIDHDSQRPVSTTNAQVLYILHAIAPFTYWILALLAVIIGAINRDSVRGTWLESHYSYLSRTFWWGLAWLVLFTVIFTLTVVGLFILFIPWFILTVWYLYRVVRGWMRLNDRAPAPE